MASLDYLPDELLLAILSEHTPLLDLANCARVCRRWRRMLDSRDFRHYHNARYHYIISAFQGLSADVLRNVDLDLTCKRGQSPLHAAAMTGDPSHVEILLRRIEVEVRPRNRLKRYIDLPDDAGHTPFLLAVARENITVVKRLADLGADVNAAGRRDRTPIHLAVEAGNVALVRLLLSYGVHLDASDRYGMTPLHLAAGASRFGMIAETPDHAAAVEIVQMLLDYGANPTALDLFSQTPLHMAALARADVFEIIMNNALASVAHSKCPREHWPRSKSEEPLKSVGSEITSEKTDGESTQSDIGSNQSECSSAKTLPSPHSARCSCMHVHPASMLDHGGCSPLHRAAETGNLAVTKVIIRQSKEVTPVLGHNVKPVDMDARAPRGSTALHLAAANGHLECLRVLISAGADVHAEDCSGQTPLYCARKHGDCARELAIAGARLRILS